MNYILRYKQEKRSEQRAKTFLIIKDFLAFFGLFVLGYVLLVLIMIIL